MTPVSAAAMFDDDLIADEGASEIQFGSTGNAFGSMLTLTVGSIVLQETNDDGFQGAKFPLLLFNNALFIGFDFLAFTDDFSNIDAFFAQYDLFNTEDEEIAGTWNLDTATTTPKEITSPATFWLFGSGLIGMFGLRYHNKQTTAIA